MKLTIYTDGASRGNPGMSASGYQIYDEKGELIAKNEIYNGEKTNNYAEYNAIINALIWCKDNIKSLNQVDIELHSDSKLVVNQINGNYKIKSPNMYELNQKVQDLIKNFKSVKFINEPREVIGISKVDKAINIFLDKKTLELKKS